MLRNISSSAKSTPHRPIQLHMLNAFTTPLGAAVMARITLLLNHVLSRETVALDRLKPHTGRSIQLRWTGWPSLLPPPPEIAFTITPAGMLEWCGNTPPLEPELRVSIDASNPAALAGQWLTGERPRVGIEGDSAFAAEVSWLLDNLRWDIEDDLAHIVGAGPAHQLCKVSSWITQGFGAAVRAVQNLALRRGGGTPP
jgi:ubiquinone biosynthesis accessory factor UbiJ